MITNLTNIWYFSTWGPPMSNPEHSPSVTIYAFAKYLCSCYTFKYNTNFSQKKFQFKVQYVFWKTISLDSIYHTFSPSFLIFHSSNKIASLFKFLVTYFNKRRRDQNFQFRSDSLLRGYCQPSSFAMCYRRRETYHMSSIQVVTLQCGDALAYCNYYLNL